MRELSAEAEALWRAVELAEPGDQGDERLVGLLVELTRVAPDTSDAWAHAHRELAAHLLPDDPWRASVSARRALKVQPHDAMAWGIVGLAQTMLGNQVYAARAYRQALRYEPNNPFYAHNLGHLLDVVFDRPAEALPLLERALEWLWEWPEASRRHRIEIRASLGHALLRTDHVAAAHAHLRAVVQSGLATQAHHALHVTARDRLEASLTEEMQRLEPIAPFRRVQKSVKTHPDRSAD